MSTFNSSRRSLFKASAAIAVAVAVSPLAWARTTVPDPIFAAIERSLELWRAHCAACRESDRTGLAFGWDSAEHEGADELQGDACSAQCDHLSEFLSIVPTTLRGLLAYIDHIGHDAAFGGVQIEPGQRELIFATIKTAIRNLAQLEA